jgi:hypothetical protein
MRLATGRFISRLPPRAAQEFFGRFGGKRWDKPRLMRDKRGDLTTPNFRLIYSTELSEDGSWLEGIRHLSAWYLKEEIH